MGDTSWQKRGAIETVGLEARLGWARLGYARLDAAGAVLGYAKVKGTLFLLLRIR